jgi:acyl-CoA thioesterase-2
MSDRQIDKLVSNLRVERIDKYLFIGRSPSRPPRIFGGQVLAQALNAALRTVEAQERTAHSMHAYFLRPGDPGKQVIYEVDPIRDGRSFTTRRVVAKQEGRAIFNTSISFHATEDGLEHQLPAPSAPDPEALESDRDYWERMNREQPGRFEIPGLIAIDRRSVDRRDFTDPASDTREPRAAVWMRVVGALPDDPVLHQTLLAYLSDMTLMSTAMLPHPHSTRDNRFMGASLDHALWFHKPLRVDEWLLYEHDSPVASGARGFIRGTFYTQSGELVASAVQEALMRIRSSE